MRKGLWPAFCAVLFITLAGISSCDFFSPESVIEVETMQVKRGNISEVISASGKVAPKETEAVTSDTNGEIVEILVEEGDDVTKDQVLVNFKQLEPVKSPVAGEVYKITCLRGQMVTIGTPLMTIVEDDTDEMWQVTSDTNGEINEILVEEGEFYTPPYSITETLLEEGDYVTKDEELITFKQPEPVKSPVAGKVRRLDCLRGQKVTVGTPLMTIGEEDTYLITSDTNGEISEILVELGDNVTVDEIVVNFEQLEPVKSPITGRVAEDNCFKGQKVTVGTPLMIIADTDPFYVMANVEEVDISKAKIGQSVSITLDAYPDVTLEGQVKSIGFSAIHTPVGSTDFPVEVAITSTDNPDLLLGMTADIEIAFATYEDVIVIPAKAVVRRDGKHAVFVIENSIANRREVELGVCTDDFCEIKSGLEPGQEIVTNNASILEGGEKVMPVSVR